MVLKNCNAEQFIKNLNGRKVICFGAGSMVKGVEFLTNYNIPYLEEHISFFVDNDINKIGLDFEFKGNIFKIYSLDILDEIDSSKYVILITCAAFSEIYEQLNILDNLKNIDCYFYTMVARFPDVDLNTFFLEEAIKPAYKNYKQRLIDLNLKDRYKGRRCFLIGNGPSLNAKDLDVLADNNEITFAVNRSYLIFNDTKWRPTYYLCSDQLCYQKDHKVINNIDSQLKFTFLGNAVTVGKVYDDIVYLDRVIGKTISDGNKVLQTISGFSYNITDGVCFSGETILYVAVQLAVYMGFTEIYLLGVDCNFQAEILPDGTVKTNDIDNHFTKEYNSGFENIVSAGVSAYKMHIVWQSAKEACEKVGVTIKNATRGGKLEVFERVDFDELMNNMRQ